MAIPDHLTEAKEAAEFFMYGKQGDDPAVKEVTSSDFLLYAVANALIAVAERLGTGI